MTQFGAAWKTNSELMLTILMVPKIFSFVETSQCYKRTSAMLTIRQGKVYLMELDDDGYLREDKYIEQFNE